MLKHFITFLRFACQFFGFCLSNIRKKDDTIFEINDNLYEDISISFNLSGRTRTAKLKDIDRFSLVEDIPDSIYNNGNTNYDDIIRHMIGTAESYKEKMVFRIAE